MKKCPALAALLLASCYSTATLHTARPIEPGEVQAAVALGSFVGEEDGEFAALPTLEGQVRFALPGARATRALAGQR